MSSSITEFGVARLTASGMLDTTFNAGGSLPGTQEVLFNTPGGTPGDADASAVVVQPNTSGIVVVGSVTPTTAPAGNPVSNIAVALLNVNGAVGSDTLPSYNGNNDDVATGVTLEGTQIVIAGTTTLQFAPSGSTASNITELTVTRLNPNGTFDTTFGTGGKYFLPLNVGGTAYSTTGNAVTVMPDGTLLVGGGASPAWTSSSNGILVDLTASGALNPSYGSNGVALLGTTYPIVSQLLGQSNGNVDFTDGSYVYQTTPPGPAVATQTPGVLLLTPNGKNVTGITVFFNTSVNSTMASNVKLYAVRIGTKGRSYIKVKRATYNASNNSVTLSFRSAVKLNKKGYQVMITGSTGIVASGAGILNNGAPFSVFISATATS